MNKYLTIPPTVKVSLKEFYIEFQGPVGDIKLEIPNSILVSKEDGRLRIQTSILTSSVKRIFGTFTSHLNNCLKGVLIGHTKQLNLVGVGYRVEDSSKDSFSFKLGYSHKVLIEKDSKTSIEVLKPTVVQLKGVNKQEVYQKASKIRKLRMPEPYKGKGILYKNETILRKEGKKLN